MTDPMDFGGDEHDLEQANLDHCIHYGKLFGDGRFENSWHPRPSIQR